MAKTTRNAITFPVLATPTSWAYLAGIIDGEGCVAINNTTGVRNKGKGRYCLRMHVANVDTRLISWLRATFGGYVHYAEPAKPQHRPAWVWHCQGTRCEVILEHILPYVIAKRDQVETALAFASTLYMVKASRLGVPTYIMEMRKGYKDKLHALKRQQYPPVSGVETKHKRGQPKTPESVQ